MTSPAVVLSTIQKLDELFKPWSRSDAPGLVVGVSHRGQAIYRRGFGLASIEHARANTPATRMRIGSTTKHFCSFGIMLLAEEGKLDIHQPVRTYLPELANVSGEPTLLQLMHHTGGLRDPMFAAFLLNRGNYGHMPAGGGLQLLARFTDLNFAPGERMAYSNAGYLLLTFVTERVSGLTWEEFMTRRVFAPMGMNETALLRSDMDIVPNMATLHMPLPDGRWRRGIYPTDEVLGSGGMISTIDDMLAWVAHLRGSRKKVGSEATWARMLERQTYRSGMQAGYGLGIARDSHRGIETIHHAGATFGSQCQMLTVPQHELDIVIMANRMDASAPALALKVVDTVLEDQGLAPPVMPAPAAEFPSVRGRWYSRQSRTLLSIAPRQVQPEAPEVLLLSMYHAPTAILQKAGDGLAMPDGPMSMIEIRTLPEGSTPPALLDVHITGELERFERLPDTPPTAEELAPALAGRYRYAGFGAELEIVLREGKLFIDFLPEVGMARWELEPLSADVLGCGTFHSIPAPSLPTFASLSIERKDGKVTGLWIGMDRVRNLRFDRVG
ncbi:serine hydrolase domain-containing protein [Solimonas sp. K1W22B-7]|uniref:serine hydrolase domain-containing protein n=1 Tax=Solimonas sp. K1W22B-7 TaxID=2303331 RepID=UPI0013C40D1F|nr:serine hydrolase domain-containing protein [Solimonas sp. K1W22B-7]